MLSYSLLPVIHQRPVSSIGPPVARSHHQLNQVDFLPFLQLLGLKRSASCWIVLSPSMAASATLALKAAEWFRRVFLVVSSPDSWHYRARCQAEMLLCALFSFVRPLHEVPHMTATVPGRGPWLTPTAASEQPENSFYATVGRDGLAASLGYAAGIRSRRVAEPVAFSGRGQQKWKNNDHKVMDRRALTGVFAVFMLGASIGPKLLRLPSAENTMAQLGRPPGGLHDRARLARMPGFRPGSEYQRPWSCPHDGTARRGHGNANPRRQPTVQPHPIQSAVRKTCSPFPTHTTPDLEGDIQCNTPSSATTTRK
jgi:hypothetical protein